MSEELTLRHASETELTEGSTAAVKHLRGIRSEFVQAQRRANFLLALPTAKVAMSSLYRDYFVRLVEASEFIESDPEVWVWVDEVWEQTEREYALRGERWEGGSL
jgi:hypothetical protein